MLFFFLIKSVHGSTAHGSVADAQKALQTPLSSMPTYITDRPPETAYNDPKALDAQQGKGFQTQGGKYMQKSLKKRPYFRLHPSQDPLLIFSQKAHKHRQALIKGQAVSMTNPRLSVMKSCREGKEALDITCTETLVEGVHHQTKRTYLYTYHRGWHHDYWSYYSYNEPGERTRQVFRHFDGCNWWDHHIVQYYQYEKRTHQFNAQTGTFEDQGWQPITEEAYNAFNPLQETSQDVWVSSCPHLASKISQGVCRLKEKKCISSLSSQTLVDAHAPLTFSRPCWQYEVIYTCQGSSKQECAPLRQQGCVQLNSTCEKVLGKECVEWRQTLRCPSAQKEVHDIQASLPAQWDHKADLSSPPNTELGDALAKLSLFQEMKKDTGIANPEIFKGTLQRCTRAFKGFKECCDKQGGWGVRLNLSNCSAEDKVTYQKREKHLCIEVGEFCAEKNLGICTRYKKSFCCFESKLLRIFQEQGRRQLGLNFGSGKHPQCRGLTLEELQRIDFSKVDLSEIHQEILSSVKVPSVKAVTTQLKDRLTTMTQGMNNTPLQGGM